MNNFIACGGCPELEACEMLAVELTGTAVLLISKAEREPQASEQIFKSIKKHVSHFCDVYMSGE